MNWKPILGFLCIAIGCVAGCGNSTPPPAPTPTQAAIPDPPEVSGDPADAAKAARKVRPKP